MPTRYRNFMNFCESIPTPKGQIELTLVTAAGSKEAELDLSMKFAEIKTDLEKHQLNLSYSLVNNIHDRWIESDTGWKIILSRGLDIFDKPDGRFTLGAIDQTKRSCKGTTITYIKKP